MDNDSPSTLKICLVIHSLGIGGMERVMSIIANYIAEHKSAEVHLILIGSKRNIEYPLCDNIQVHYPSFKFKNRRRTYDTVRTMIFLRNKLKDLEPDCVLSFGEMWNNLVLISSMGTGFRVYISDRSKPGKNLGKLHNTLRNILYPKAVGYIAQTKIAEDLCQSNKWNDNIEVIGNPVNQIPEDKNNKKENIVLFVGRLIKTKHADQLIKIFNNVNNNEWKLCIVGGDAKRLSLTKELDALVKNLGAEEQILLEGEQNDVAQYYNKSKIFAFPSSSEGFPNVIGEALSAGLPVVAYDCVAGPSDLINDGENGFLIELFNTEEFKEKLSLLMKDDELRDEMSRTAKKSIQKFESDRIAEKFYNFITHSE